MPALSSSAASVYSGYEVDDDWCVSVLQSYQTDRDVPFPWSVGKSQVFPHLLTTHTLTVYGLTLLMSPGEDMTLEGRRQLALFLVSLLYSISSCTVVFPVWFKSNTTYFLSWLGQFRCVLKKYFFSSISPIFLFKVGLPSLFSKSMEEEKIE